LSLDLQLSLDLLVIKLRLLTAQGERIL